MSEWTWPIALITSIGAVFAAAGAWMSARETRKSVQAQLIVDLKDTYDAPEMLAGMKNLTEWRPHHGDNFAKEFANLRDKNYPKVANIDEARRRYSHYFGKIWLLMDERLIPVNTVKKVVTPQQAEIVRDFIEPLELAIDPNFDDQAFKALKKMWPMAGTLGS